MKKDINIVNNKKEGESIIEKIIIFTIGILVGAVITTGSFLISSKINCYNNQNIMMNNRMIHEIPNNQTSENKEFNKPFKKSNNMDNNTTNTDENN